MSTFTGENGENEENEAARIEAAARFLRERLGGRQQARVAVVLGSGLGALAAKLAGPLSIPFGEVPYFPVSGVPGHAGQLVAGALAGVPLLVMQGRVHAYEGHSANAIVFAVRTLALLGIKALILTNAAGGIRLDLHPGQLVLIADHINFSGLNPAVGSPIEKLPRFFDMSETYSRRLRELAHAAAAAQGASITEGIYISVLGPSFETPAEIRAFRTWGADLVGMSTVLETIAARQAGMEVLGISCVTNMAAGVERQTLSHEEVIETGRKAEQQLTNLLAGILPRAARSLEQLPESLLLDDWEDEAEQD